MAKTKTTLSRTPRRRAQDKSQSFGRRIYIRATPLLRRYSLVTPVVEGTSQGTAALVLLCFSCLSLYTQTDSNMLRLTAVLLLATLSAAAPRDDRRVVGNRWLQARPQGSELLVDAQIGSVLRHAPQGARLLAVSPPLPTIIDRLPDNATLIRPNLVDTFRCTDRKYGYYGDVDNGCQVFHVCLPLHQLYPANFTAPVTYQFSFICPEQTVFTQDAMVCAWASEALPCEATPELYWMNDNFFREVPKENGGVRYAQLNEKP
ncbi:uncharacterized protein LOC125045318 [Penaeus chinensis]|uniref:uncharacterized protein LOC125045318 n=1 Tax=Penaeus chinensis TaxID=139456 RepID=UPI001FB7E322|nr:uncharacterized protein LOC125045318 [Penaeus chinensis]